MYSICTEGDCKLRSGTPSLRTALPRLICDVGVCSHLKETTARLEATFCPAVPRYRPARSCFSARTTRHPPSARRAAGMAPLSKEQVLDAIELPDVVTAEDETAALQRGLDLLRRPTKSGFPRCERSRRPRK